VLYAMFIRQSALTFSSALSARSRSTTCSKSWISFLLEGFVASFQKTITMCSLMALEVDKINAGVHKYGNVFSPSGIHGLEARDKVCSILPLRQNT
jgi:hypothetical protein